MKGLRRTLGRAGESFFSNKQNFDRNIETILDFVSIPSKRDVRELKARLDHLNGQLVNLSIKIDRMLAESQTEILALRNATSKTRAARKPASKIVAQKIGPRRHQTRSSCAYSVRDLDCARFPPGRSTSAVRDRGPVRQSSARSAVSFT